MVNPENIAAIFPKTTVNFHLIRNKAVNFCLDLCQEIHSCKYVAIATNKGNKKGINMHKDKRGNKTQ